jgi:hypothetical protein
MKQTPVRSLAPFGPSRFNRRENRTVFEFRLVNVDGRPADPTTLKAAVPNWRPGDTIALGRGRMLRVVEARLEEGSDGEPVSVLVVEETGPKRPLAA